MNSRIQNQWQLVDDLGLVMYENTAARLLRGDSGLRLKGIEQKLTHQYTVE